MTDLPKWLSELAAKARQRHNTPHTSRNLQLTSELHWLDRDEDDLICLLIDHIEELRAFVRECPCWCIDVCNLQCERCRLLGEGGER